MPATLDRVLAFAHATRPSGGEAASDAGIARALDEYLGRGGRRLARVEVRSSGKPFPTLYEAIREESFGRSAVELTVIDPPAAGPAWEFLRPFRRVDLFPDGSAELFPASGPSQRAIARFLVREAAAARRSGRREPMGLAPLPDALAYLRSGRIVPFRLALLLYLSDERVRYELDLTADELLKDPRAGRLSAARKVRRPPRAAWAIDRQSASGALAPSDARILEILSELHSATLQELALAFGGDGEAVRASLERLAVEGLVLSDRSSGLSKIHPDAFRLAATPTPWPAEGEASAPAGTELTLHRELEQLIASADASATCPVCGDHLPPGHRGIVCARCEAAVAGTPGDG